MQAKLSLEKAAEAPDAAKKLAENLLKETVEDKGYHSNDVLSLLRALWMRWAASVGVTRRPAATCADPMIFTSAMTFATDC